MQPITVAVVQHDVNVAVEAACSKSCDDTQHRTICHCIPYAGPFNMTWTEERGTHPAELLAADRAGHVVAAAILLDAAAAARARLCVMPHPLCGILFVFFPHVCKGVPPQHCLHPRPQHDIGYECKAWQARFVCIKSCVVQTS